MRPELIEIKKKVVPLLKKYGVVRAGIFGSYARGEQTKKSDVDLLVKTRKGTSLIDFIGIKHAAEEVLGKRVDMVEYTALKKMIKDRIFNDEVRIL